jgi:hypothetical protein
MESKCRYSTILDDGDRRESAFQEKAGRGEDRSPGLVAHRLLPKKQLPLPQGRPLRDITPYYSRSVDRRKEFVLGPKPGVLKGVGTIDKKVWKQYQTHLDRTTPLERAEFYAQEMKERRMRSFRALSLLLGEPVRRVDRYVRLLELPEPIKVFLRDHREPEYLRYFSERRLQELVHLGDTRAAWRRFQAMVREAESDAGIWKNNGQ